MLEILKRRKGSEHPLIDKLDLRPQRKLTAFLAVKPDNIVSITPLNNTIRGVGDTIYKIIEERGFEKNLGGIPAHTIEMPLADGKIAAFYGVVPGLISIHRSFLEGREPQMNYHVYLPFGEGMQLIPVHAEKGNKPRYYARDEIRGVNFDPEHNPQDPQSIQGYLSLAQQATRDLLQAAGLLKK
jgi:hypothetical protein